MEQIFSTEEFQDAINNETFVLTYFSGVNCSVCESQKPRIEEEVSFRMPEVKMIEIPVEEAKELAASYSVFTVPVVHFYVDGKKYIKEARSFSVSGLLNKMEKIIGLNDEEPNY